MVYPPCEASVAVAPAVTSAFGPSKFSPNTFIKPEMELPSSCVDPASGFVIADSACVDANLAIQHRNQAKWDQANRNVFLANCHDMIAAENDSRRSRGIPLQIDDCDQRTFGQTLPGTSGGAVQSQIPPAYVAVADAKAAEAIKNAAADPTNANAQAEAANAKTGAEQAKKKAQSETKNDGSEESSAAVYWIVGGIAVAALVYVAVNR